MLKSNSLKNLVISDKYIRGEFKEPHNKKNQFITVRVQPELAQELQSSGVTYTQEVESSFFREILSWVIPALIFVFIW
jgi:cell division protease FtsH